MNLLQYSKDGKGAYGKQDKNNFWLSSLQALGLTRTFIFLVKLTFTQYWVTCSLQGWVEISS